MAVTPSSNNPHIFVLTGAGVSAEAGLGTFRDAGGLWAKYDLAEVATPEAFARDPARVYEFYNMRRRGVVTAAPHAGHEALARLQTDLATRGGRLSLVTQNIDDLHERAGAQDVVHMHGELLKARCTGCGALTPWRDDLTDTDACSACANPLRPHVVWFGEMPLFMAEIAAALRVADLFVSIGTSGAVYPAAGFVAEARAQGTPTLELNLEPSDNHHLFTDGRYGPASEIVPRWVDEMLGAQG